MPWTESIEEHKKTNRIVLRLSVPSNASKLNYHIDWISCRVLSFLGIFNPQQIPLDRFNVSLVKGKWFELYSDAEKQQYFFIMEVQIIIGRIESSKFMTQITLERTSKIKSNHKYFVSYYCYLDPMQRLSTFTNSICFIVAAISIRY